MAKLQSCERRPAADAGEDQRIVDHAIASLELYRVLLVTRASLLVTGASLLVARTSYMLHCRFCGYTLNHQHGNETYVPISDDPLVLQAGDMNSISR